MQAEHIEAGTNTGMQNPVNLVEQYRCALDRPDMVQDDSQLQAVEKLQLLGDAIETATKPSLTASLRTALSGFLPLRVRARHKIKGLYLWGSVGRGKTWLMNMFFEQLDTSCKQRLHFHHFMLEIHRQLDHYSNKKQKNPLPLIAARLAKKYQILCIDEFIVTNITDAMILSELLHALFHHGVILVATSNRIPDDLYLNGLQRERFLPAIELIKTHCDIFHLDNGVDHRTALLGLDNIYYTPIEPDTGQQLLLRMQELAISPIRENINIEVHKRNIFCRRCSDEIAWFDFNTLCSAPRAAQDYIELAKRYSTLFVTDIPVMDEYSDDKARRFIYLIDELYDRNVKLIASAEQPPDKLYRGSMLEFAFHRTSSRLVEMRSHQYLSAVHKPFD